MIRKILPTINRNDAKLFKNREAREVEGTPVGIVSQTDLIQVIEEFDWGWELHE